MAQPVLAANLGSRQPSLLLLDNADDLLLGEATVPHSSAYSLRAESTSNRVSQRGASHEDWPRGAFGNKPPITMLNIGDAPSPSP